MYVIENIIVGNHSWKRKKIKDAWDVQVYIGDRSIQNDTGEDITGVNRRDWCMEHHCDEHSPYYGGPCAFNVTLKPVYETKHHDARYKIYCSKCGATK